MSRKTQTEFQSCPACRTPYFVCCSAPNASRCTNTLQLKNLKTSCAPSLITMARVFLPLPFLSPFLANLCVYPVGHSMLQHVMAIASFANSCVYPHSTESAPGLFMPFIPTPTSPCVWLCHRRPILLLRHHQPRVLKGATVQLCDCHAVHKNSSVPHHL